MYKILEQNIFSIDNYNIIPIREEDIFLIKKWRNEQIKFLRQDKIINDEEQRIYYDHYIKSEFEKDFPKQILFSILNKKKLVGYGGLVHIDWRNKNGEISFLLETSLYSNQLYYNDSFNAFLKMIQEVAKKTSLKKIFTFGYDISAYRFLPLKQQNFLKEAHLVKHVKVKDEIKDVIIYSKFL